MSQHKQEGCQIRNDLAALLLMLAEDDTLKEPRKRELFQWIQECCEKTEDLS